MTSYPLRVGEGVPAAVVAAAAVDAEVVDAYCYFITGASG
jgi:hypothetical protein